MFLQENLVLYLVVEYFGNKLEIKDVVFLNVRVFYYLFSKIE